MNLPNFHHNLKMYHPIPPLIFYLKQLMILHIVFASFHHKQVQIYFTFKVIYSNELLLGQNEREVDT